MEFSTQKYWSVFPFPPPGDLPNPGIKSASPACPTLQADSLPDSLYISRHISFIALYCTLKIYYIFYKLKVCGNLAVSKSIDAIFHMAFVYFVSLGHILVILRTFSIFSVLLYLLWWSVISDLWCFQYDWRLRWWFVFFSNKTFLN